MSWCDRTGDANIGRWAELKRWVAAHGFMVGRDCLEQTTGGGHATTSLHYTGMAVDFGDAGVDYVAIARWLVPFATGPDRVIDELFCADDGIAWSHGAPSSFHDNPAHTHVGLRPGAKLVIQEQGQREDDEWVP